MRISKKTVVIGALLMLAAGSLSAQNGSLRLGLEFGNPQAVIIVRPGPFDLKIGYSFTADYLFLAGDYRVVSGYQLIDFLHLFLSVGAYTSIDFGAAGNVGFGARIPLGLQAFLMGNALELFVEVAPTVTFIPDIGFGGLNAMQGYAGFTVRIR